MDKDLEVIVNERLAESSIGQQMLLNEQEQKLTRLAINEAKVPLSTGDFTDFDNVIEFLDSKVEEVMVKWSQQGPTDSSSKNLVVAEFGLRRLKLMHSHNRLSGKESARITEIATAMHNGLWEEAKQIHLKAVGAYTKRESWCWLRGLRCLIQACIDLPTS